MKKILSLALVGVMALSMVPTALATTDYTNGTLVKYVGTGDAEYTITVPALLAPGDEGDVTLQGTWASDATVKVTADQTVILTNSINEADQKVLDVTFAGIEKAGDNTQTVQAVEAVSVSDISNALFGTWSGKFNYNVEYVESAKTATFSMGYSDWGSPMAITYEPGMTWAEWVNSTYNSIIIWNYDEDDTAPEYDEDDGCKFGIDEDGNVNIQDRDGVQHDALYKGDWLPVAADEVIDPTCDYFVEM